MRVTYCECQNSDVNTIFLQNFAALERLHFRLPRENAATRIDEVKPFLEKHSKLKHFQIDSDFLWANRHIFNHTNIQLDSLNISFDPWLVTSPSNELIAFLKTLHVHRFYKTLEISSAIRISDEMSKTIETIPTFEKLSIHQDLFVDLNRFSNLRELQFNGILSPTNMEIVAMNLSKLERLKVNFSTASGIAPFVRYSKRLTTIAVSYFLDFEKLDLVKLNYDREALAHACQVLIGMAESIYFHYNWKRQNLNLNRVKIVRLHSSEIPYNNC